GNVELALEGQCRAAAVGVVHPQEVHVLVLVLGGELGQVGSFGAAGRAGGVPEIDHDDVAAPVGQVDVLLFVGGSGQFHRLITFGGVPGGDPAVAGDVSTGLGWGGLRVRAGAAGEHHQQGGYQSQQAPGARGSAGWSSTATHARRSSTATVADRSSTAMNAGHGSTA